MYGNSSRLIFGSESNPVVLQSQQGVHQGDPLGPALFATGIQDILVKTQVDHVDVTFLAYLDDVFILGPPTKCLDAFNDFKSVLKSAKLSICDRKCEAYSADHWPEYIPFSSNGIVILGIPMDTPDFVSSHCVDIAETGRVLCSELPLLDDPQAATLLLRHCHVPRLNHLARAVHYNLLLPASLSHDRATRDTFCSVVGIDVSREDKWLQRCLPVRLGGFGLYNIQQVSPSAFLAAYTRESSNTISRRTGACCFLS